MQTRCSGKQVSHSSQMSTASGVPYPTCGIPVNQSIETVTSSMQLVLDLLLSDSSTASYGRWSCLAVQPSVLVTVINAHTWQ